MAGTLRIVDARGTAHVGEAVRVRGWVRTRRDSKGGFSFLEVNDGSCLGNLQVLADQNLSNYEDTVRHIPAGASVTVEGMLKASPAAGQATELVATDVVLHGGADPESYPLQKKRHTLEKLREWAHLRPRTNTIGAVARVRNRLSYSIHQFFQEQGFLYIHTPIITASDCEGAGAMFRVTTLDADKPPRDAKGAVDAARDFFGRPAYLTVSGQLEGEIYACALGQIYTFGPTFRAENSNTARHLAEFWMVEPEMAFYDLQDNMDLAERFIQRLVRDVLADCREDMEFFAERIDKEAIARAEHILAGRFARVTYTEAIDVLLASGASFQFPVSWGMDLQSEHERYLTEKHYKRPTIVYDYPASLKPFYMRVNDDERGPDVLTGPDAGRLTVRAMDILAPSVGEIIGGSQREERLPMLEARMAAQHLDPAAYWWYLELRKYGTVPHAGFGLGLERILLLVTGMANIRDVIPFPRTPGSAEF